MRHHTTINGVHRQLKAMLGDGFDIPTITTMCLVVSRKRRVFKYRLCRSEKRIMRLAAANQVEMT